MRRLGFLGLLIASAVVPVAARRDAAGCGTSDSTPAEVMFLHRQAARRNAGRPRPLAAGPTASTNRDIGNIAIIEDSDGVVETLNQFNLDGSTLTFTPLGRGRAIDTPTREPATIRGAADQGSPVVALGDDDSRTFALPFAFPFYGATYTQVFLNSDGNLTFTAAESASTSRSVGRMTGGPPRISPPVRRSRPLQHRRQRALLRRRQPRRLQLGERAPSIRDRRSRRPFRCGCTWMAAFSSPTQASIPSAPWWASLPDPRRPGTSVVSFHNDPSGEYSAAVVERFGNTQEIDIVTVAQRFYETHEDAYDYLVIYNNMGIGAQRGRAGLRGHRALQRHAATASQPAG